MNNDEPDREDEFAAEFNKDDDASDGMDAGAQAAKTGSAGSPAVNAQASANSGQAADASAAPADNAASNAAAPDMSAETQRLQQLETSLQARNAELDAREAAMRQSNVNDRQTTSATTGNTDGDDGDDGGDGGADPATVLARDFGEDFVELVTQLVTQICDEQIGKGVGSVAATVDQLIQQLTNERQHNHFKTIAAAHGDFMEVVESPEFMAWKAAQAPAKQSDIARVIASGSAQEIIDLLTAFKQSKASQSTATDDAALDAAEGVRSSGIKLPKAPTPADDFAAAWNEA